MRRIALLLFIVSSGCLPKWFIEPSVELRPPSGPSKERGREVLLNQSFLKLGVPVRLVDTFYKPKLTAEDEPTGLKGRRGINDFVPTGYTGRVIDGVPTVTENCLLCHAGPLRGEWVMGLGNSMIDAVIPVDQVLIDPAKLKAKNPTPEELAIIDAWSGYQTQIAPYARAKTPGTVAALYFTGFFFSHRDPATLQWVDAAAFPMLESSPPETDIPAWWLLKKKKCLYYGCELTGDFTRSLMQFMTPRGNTGDDIRAAEGDFSDVLAYLRSLQAPAFPGVIDHALADDGEKTFDRVCAICHGTYGAVPSYPNVVVPLEKIGTDPLRNQFMHELGFAEHYNRSWYGEHSKLRATSGYLAPPLDGVWATAPYLHNGSVPTLEALLDPTLRPAAFIRPRDSRRYDLQRVGWDVTRTTGFGPQVFDTTMPGKSNAGHEFGAALSVDERRAVLEYLKTL